MSLTSEVHRLAEGFLESYDKRIAAVMTIRGSAAEELDECRVQRQHVADEQRQKLTEYVGSLRDKAAKTLRSLETAHENMATDLRKHLAGGREQLAADAKRMRGMRHDGREQLAADVERMRGMMHDDHIGARKALKKLNATMREHRIRAGSG